MSIVVNAPATSDGESPAQSAGWVLDINVINPPITLTGNPPTPATVGQPYFGTLTATGGDGTPFTWSVSGLPHGLAATANGATPTISGTHRGGHPAIQAGDLAGGRECL
jgi:hypothetical protein